MRKGPRISANLDRMFTDLDLPERIAAAAEAGFRGVEIPLPYDHPAPDLRDKAIFAGIPILRVDAPPPNYTGGPQGFAAHPDCRERFRRDVVRVGRQADVLGANLVHLRSGQDGTCDAQVLIDNLRYAAAQSPKTTFLVELLNPRDHPAHCLADVDDAVRVIDSVDRPNVRLMFSTWHANRHPSGLGGTWQRCAAFVGHVILGGGHAGQSDHRAQAMMELVKLAGYTGWVCADYTPRGSTVASLGWLTS